MAKVIYLSGNYVVVTDANNVDRVFPIGKTVYEETAGNFLISEGQVEREQLIIPVSDAVNWVDNDGTNYTEATFRDFLRTNTGFRPASGGSGAAPVGATLMKTNQTVVLRTGDDGDIQAGRATDFFTLASQNPFATFERFTDELGGQTYTNNIVIDWSTYNGTDVLGYARNFQQGTWDIAIDNSLTFSVGSYTSQWRLANIREMANLADYSYWNTMLYAPFNVSGYQVFYTSTAQPTSSTRCLIFRNYDGEIDGSGKTSTYEYMPVRNFTVSGTTLT